MEPGPAISRPAALLRLAFSGLFLLLLVVLHFLKPEFAPSWRFVTTHGSLHGLAAMVGIPGLPIAAVLISRSLVRNQAWSTTRRLLLWAAHLTWMSVVLMFASMFIMLSQTQGKFGPSVLIGWPNRLVVLTYCGWLMTVGWRAYRLRNQRSREK